jgi:hypothetical protein
MTGNSLTDPSPYGDDDLNWEDAPVPGAETDVAPGLSPAMEALQAKAVEAGLQPDYMEAETAVTEGQVDLDADNSGQIFKSDRRANTRYAIITQQVETIRLLINMADENGRAEDENLGKLIRNTFGYDGQQLDKLVRRLRRERYVEFERHPENKHVWKAGTINPRTIRTAITNGRLPEDPALKTELDEKFPRPSVKAKEPSRPLHESLAEARAAAPVKVTIDPSIARRKQLETAIKGSQSEKEWKKSLVKTMHMEFGIGEISFKFRGNVGKFMKFSNDIKLLLTVGNFPRVYGNADGELQMEIILKHLNKGLPDGKQVTPDEAKKLVDAAFEKGHLKLVKPAGQTNNGNAKRYELTSKAAPDLHEALEAAKPNKKKEFNSTGFGDGADSI